MIERIKSWYEGRLVRDADNPDASLVFPSPLYERSASARAARRFVECHRRDWRTLATIYVAIIGVIVAIIGIVVTVLR